MRIEIPYLSWLSCLLCLASLGIANAGGILLYESASDNVGLAESWCLTTGLSHAFDRSAELKLGYAFVWVDGMPVAQSKGINGRISTSGEFADAAVHVLSSSITWRY